MDIVKVPQLGDDMCIPDYCYTGEDEDVNINVWILFRSHSWEMMYVSQITAIQGRMKMWISMYGLDQGEQFLLYIQILNIIFYVRFTVYYIK